MFRDVGMSRSWMSLLSFEQFSWAWKFCSVLTLGRLAEAYSTFFWGSVWSFFEDSCKVLWISFQYRSERCLEVFTRFFPSRADSMRFSKALFQTFIFCCVVDDHHERGMALKVESLLKCPSRFSDSSSDSLWDWGYRRRHQLLIHVLFKSANCFV